MEPVAEGVGIFQGLRERSSRKEDAGTTLTRERWLLILFSELGSGCLLTNKKPIEVNEKSYSISHGWQNTPIHLVSFKVDLDHDTQELLLELSQQPA